MIEDLSGKYHFNPKYNPSLRAWRNAGKKAVGYVCTSIPEEMIHASGMLPVRLWGTTEEVVKASGYCANFTCHVVRSILEMGLNGDLNCLDGLVVDYGCEAAMVAMQPLVETVKFDFLGYLLIPHTRKTSTQQFFTQEIQKFKRQLEEFTGVELTDQRLEESISIYNTNRGLLRRVYDLRGEGRLTNVEVAELLATSSLMPKELHNQLLTEVINETEKRVPYKYRARLHVSGTMLPPDYELFRLVEDLGAVVVSDDLCTGTRYFWKDVSNTLPPINALVDYILNVKQHCPYIFENGSWESNMNYLQEMLGRFGAQGILFLTQKWCDAMSFQRRYREIELYEKGIPWINFEVERTVGVAQLKTRLEALLEVIETSNT
ncbi:MAG: 2-hydroxyacyl-CoA dehydratase subunit D [Bacillota bacterium]